MVVCENTYVLVFSKTTNIGERRCLRERTMEDSYQAEAKKSLPEISLSKRSFLMKDIQPVQIDTLASAYSTLGFEPL